MEFTELSVKTFSKVSRNSPACGRCLRVARSFSEQPLCACATGGTYRGFIDCYFRKAFNSSQESGSSDSTGSPGRNTGQFRLPRSQFVVRWYEMYLGAPGEGDKTSNERLIDFLCGDTIEAKALRDHVVFKIVPMLNPDGVFVGNYRTSLLGSDLNRCWQDPSPLAHPSIHVTKSLVEGLAHNSVEGDLDMYLDLHAHTGLLGTFVYGNSYDDVYRQERHALFPKHLSYFAQDFCLQNTVYNRDPGKSGTSRRFFASLLNDKVNCYTVEVSFFGYPSAEGNKVIPYAEDTYLRLGENIGKALLDYYTAIGHIPGSGAKGLKGGRGMSDRGRGRAGGVSRGRAMPPPSKGRGRGKATTTKPK